MSSLSHTLVRTFPKQPRAYVDMDGVIADYEAGANLAKVPMNDFQMRAGAFRNLPVFEGAHAALDALEGMGFFLFILTRIPSENPYAAMEKILWLKDNFPRLQDHIAITPDKGALGRPGDILIDDHPEWSNGDDFGGDVFRFEGNWTTTVQDVKALVQGRSS